MTSSRGQNVSVFHVRGSEKWSPPITAFTDTGGSLRSLPRKNCTDADKSTATNKKASGQNLLRNVFNGTHANFQNKECAFNNSCPDAGFGTSDANSIDRELSPVRWCDRKVDGVYLGKSGWVQVQQRSLDENKVVSTFSTSARKHFSDLDFTDGCRGEGRPLNSSLSTMKPIVRENYERPSKFIQEFGSVSPPSVTPIISPPPAFKDDGSNVEFSRRSVRKAHFSDKPSVLRFQRNDGVETSSRTSKEDRISSETFPSGLAASSVSVPKHVPASYGTLKTKSLEDDLFNGIRRDAHFDYSTARTLFGFRSLDDDLREVGIDTVNEVSEKRFRNFETPTGKRDCGERDEEEDVDERSLGYRNSSEEESDGLVKNLSKSFHQRSSQRNGRHNLNSFRARSSSLESSSSSSGSSSSGEDSSRARSSRKGFKEKQSFELDNSANKNGKSFYVKRSKSLQLSEQRSPSEPAMNHSVSGKSWGATPLECLSFQIGSQNSENSSKFPQHFPHSLVTVCGDSIPVSTCGSHPLKSLSKIARSEEEQKKLIKEAEKEARIVSEFLNGARSRAAARNLLMHRYFSGKGSGNSTEPTEDDPPKTERGFPFSANNRINQTKTMFSDTDHGRGNFFKKNRPNSPNPVPWGAAAVYSKPFNFDISSQNKSAASNASEGQKRIQRVENKKSNRPSSGQCSSDRQNCQNSNRYPSQRRSETFEKSPSFLTNQKQTAKIFIRQNVGEPAGDPEMANPKNSKRLGLPSKTTQTEGRNPAKSSPKSSSASNSAFLFDPSLKENFPIVNREFGFLVENFKKPLNVCNFQSRSTPESDDSVSPEADHRSLSLPRSFLSDCYNQRDFQILQWNQNGSGDRDELTEDFQRSRTAPTTPTREFKFGKDSKSLSQTQCDNSSCVFLLEKSSVFKSPQISQKMASEKPKFSDVSRNEENKFLMFRSSSSTPENSSKTALRNLKKKFPLRYFKATGYFKDSATKQDTECKNEISNEMFLTKTRPIFNQLVQENLEQLLETTTRFPEDRLSQKKGFKNEKYDSHDSGIQMGNRGYVDSSESQDTDFQDDFDSPLLVRKREILGRDSLRKSHSEIASQIFTHQSKGNIRSPIMRKHNRGKGVRRTYSDLGSRKSSYLDIKNSPRLVGYSPSARGQHPHVWSSGPEDAEILGKFVKAGLRRSLSHPAGLNELLSFSRKSPTPKRFTLSENEDGSRGKNSEDECLSDSESSLASPRETKRTAHFSSKEKAAVLAEAVWDHVAIESCELPFRAGEVIEVLDTRNSDWWWGATAQSKGYFPSAFVRLRVNQEDTVEDCLDAMAKGKCSSDRLRRGKSISLLSNDQVRSSVVSELLNTERDFVKILRDVKDGYIEQCKRRTDMFTPEQITSIFSNLEDVLNFQEKFLKDLEMEVDREFPYRSCIGQVFLTHGLGFHKYSEYCNSHPIAIGTLQDLYQKSNYCKFFETCRLKQSLIEIPLDGYLLTPVQRICKYPLQLAELLKYTKPDHPDFEKLEEALETMRRVATLINERKRKMESLEKLAAWQQRVEGWEGGDLIELSSRLIHQGDVVRITYGKWTTNATLFLFDHQIIYCKKDLLKRNVYIYKGRIFLDASYVVDVPDGKNHQLGVTVKYGLQICSTSGDKWLLFCCRSNEDKIKWLEALAEERKLVVTDNDVDLDLPLKAKELAKMMATTKKCPPSKPRYKNKIASSHQEVPLRNCHASTSKSKTNRRVGTWFTFGGVMKISKASPKHRTALHRIT